MFWDIQRTNSNIISLLDKEDLQLSDIIQEENLIHECKAQCTKLINFLKQPENLKQLINFLITVPNEAFKEKDCYSRSILSKDLEEGYELSNLASEILTSDNNPIYLEIVHNDEFINTLLNFFIGNEDPVIVASISRLIIHLLNYSPDIMLDQFKKYHNFLLNLNKNLISSAHTDLIIHMASKLESEKALLKYSQWFVDVGYIEDLISYLNPNIICDQLIHDTVYLIINEIFKNSTSFDYLQPGNMPDKLVPLVLNILSEPTIDTLFSYAFPRFTNNQIIKPDINQTSNESSNSFIQDSSIQNVSTEVKESLTSPAEASPSSNCDKSLNINDNMPSELLAKSSSLNSIKILQFLFEFLVINHITLLAQYEITKFNHRKNSINITNTDEKIDDSENKDSKDNLGNDLSPHSNTNEDTEVKNNSNNLPNHEDGLEGEKLNISADTKLPTPDLLQTHVELPDDTKTLDGEIISLAHEVVLKHVDMMVPFLRMDPSSLNIYGQPHSLNDGPSYQNVTYNISNSSNDQSNTLNQDLRKEEEKDEAIFNTNVIDPIDPIPKLPVNLPFQVSWAHRYFIVQIVESFVTSNYWSLLHNIYHNKILILILDLFFEFPEISLIQNHVIDIFRALYCNLDKRPTCDTLYTNETFFQDEFDKNISHISASFSPFASPAACYVTDGSEEDPEEEEKAPLNDSIASSKADSTELENGDLTTMTQDAIDSTELNISNNYLTVEEISTHPPGEQENCCNEAKGDDNNNNHESQPIKRLYKPQLSLPNNLDESSFHHLQTGKDRKIFKEIYGKELNTNYRILVQIFDEYNLLARLLSAWEENDIAEEIGIPRRSNICHIIQIANLIQEYESVLSPTDSLISRVNKEVREAWAELVKGPLARANEIKIAQPALNKMAWHDSFAYAANSISNQLLSMAEEENDVKDEIFKQSEIDKTFPYDQEAEARFESCFYNYNNDAFLLNEQESGSKAQYAGQQNFGGDDFIDFQEYDDNHQFNNNNNNNQHQEQLHSFKGGSFSPTSPPSRFQQANFTSPFDNYDDNDIEDDDESASPSTQFYKMCNENYSTLSPPLSTTETLQIASPGGEASVIDPQDMSPSTVSVLHLTPSLTASSPVSGFILSPLKDSPSAMKKQKCGVSGVAPRTPHNSKQLPSTAKSPFKSIIPSPHAPLTDYNKTTSYDNLSTIYTEEVEPKIHDHENADEDFEWNSPDLKSLTDDEYDKDTPCKQDTVVSTTLEKGIFYTLTPSLTITSPSHPVGPKILKNDITSLDDVNDNNYTDKAGDPTTSTSVSLYTESQDEDLLLLQNPSHDINHLQRSSTPERTVNDTTNHAHMSTSQISIISPENVIPNAFENLNLQNENQVSTPNSTKTTTDTKEANNDISLNFNSPFKKSFGTPMMTDKHLISSVTSPFSPRNDFLSPLSAKGHPKFIDVSPSPNITKSSFTNMNGQITTLNIDPFNLELDQQPNMEVDKTALKESKVDLDRQWDDNFS